VSQSFHHLPAHAPAVGANARKMGLRASTSLAPGCLSPEYSMDWQKLHSSPAHCRNCIATSGRKPLRTRRRQPQTKGHKSVASCKGSHGTHQCCNLPTTLIALPRVAAVPLSILVKLSVRPAARCASASDRFIAGDCHWLPRRGLRPSFISSGAVGIHGQLWLEVADPYGLSAVSSEP
jgi:hypothetical protein